MKKNKKLKNWFIRSGLVIILVSQMPSSVFAQDDESKIIYLQDIKETEEVEEVQETDDSEVIEETEDIKEISKVDTIYINWEFIVYEKPDFTSEKIANILPQTVTVLERLSDDWGLIKTYYGEGWVYLAENKIHLDSIHPLYLNMGDTEYNCVINPQVVKVIEQNGNWFLISTWLGDRWIHKTPTKPIVKLDVPIFNQVELGYPTGCEVVSLAMMINYNVQASVDNLFAEIPYSYDPYKGYRGDPKSKSGFTIFPSALTTITEQYLDTSHDISGSTMEDLKQKLSDGKAVIVWVKGLGFNVHCICLTGYNEKGFYYNDPWTGEKDAFIEYGAFYTIWNDSIFNTNTESTPRKALSY